MKEFQVQSGKRSVIVKFSEKQTAPSLEEILVKILNQNSH